MRRLIPLLLIVFACKDARVSPDRGSADRLGRGSDAGVAPDRGSAARAPVYRTDASTWHVDPSVAGTGKTFLVVSEDRLATQTGRDVLAAGGNAVDAAVATAFALAVTYPTAGNLAGGGFAVVRTGKGTATALDFRETAPAGATADMFVDAQGKPTRASLVGDLASGVPGSVAGLWALHGKLGKKPWRDVVAPAIALARDGFAVPATLHALLELRLKRPGLSPAVTALWMPGGKARATGEVVKNPELAAVLERIAAHGADGFYQGETAAAIVDEMKRGGGLITAQDLAGYAPVWREPLRAEYRGRHLLTMPPPSSGGIVLVMTANVLRAIEERSETMGGGGHDGSAGRAGGKAPRGDDLGKLGWHSTEHVHRVVEAWRRAFAARNEILGDPAFVKDLPLARLLSQAYGDQLAATIGPRATPSAQVSGLIEGTHTTNLCVVDGTGMAVALTTTLNESFGSGVMVSGFMMNDEMDDFTAKPGEPNAYGLRQGTANKIEPGKRMLSSMSPTIVEDDHGELAMVVGAQGGPRIITAIWQVISNVYDFGLPIDAAVAAPRLHHQHLPDDVVVDPDGITREVADALMSLGYTVISDPARIYGAANAIVRTKDGWAGAADPRRGGAALGD